MSVELHLRLPRHDSAAGIARKALDRRFADELGRERVGDLALVVSELVTNAVSHGQGAISLTVRVDGDDVFGEVVDEGAASSERYENAAPKT